MPLQVDAVYVMDKGPERRIASIRPAVAPPRALSGEEKPVLLGAVRNCHIHNSLSPDVEVAVEIIG